MTLNRNFDWEKAADAFYGEKTRKEKAQKEERNLLLKELRDDLTPAQILYSNNEKLKNMLEEKKKSTSAKIADGYNYDDIINNPNLSKEEKLESIKARGQETKNKIEKQGKKEIAKQIALGAAEICASFIPAAKGGQIGGRVAQNLLKKQLGRKVSTSIGQGAGAGVVAGGVQGAIEGIKKDKIPQETIKGSAIGLGLGALGAGTIAKAEEKIRGHIIKNTPDIYAMTNEARKNFRNQVKKFHKDYNQDVVVKNQDTGLDINIVGKSGKESINKSLENAKALPDLKNDLKKAKLEEKSELYKKRKDDAEEFYILQGDNTHYLLKAKDAIRHYLTRKGKR